VGSSRLSVHAALHNLRDDSAQGVSMTQPEGIGLAERLPHGGIALGRTLIRPDEHVPEELDPVELVYPENGVRVHAARQIRE
jgi:hypothetical protein